MAAQQIDIDTVAEERCSIPQTHRTVTRSSNLTQPFVAPSKNLCFNLQPLAKIEKHSQTIYSIETDEEAELASAIPDERQRKSAIKKPCGKPRFDLHG